MSRNRLPVLLLAVLATLSLHSGNLAYADPDPTTIEEWCPTFSAGGTPPGCVYDSATWTCKTAATKPWCCVTKTTTYACAGGLLVDVRQQWNKDKAHCTGDQKSCISNTPGSEPGED